jgi:hypothetical protein
MWWSIRSLYLVELLYSDVGHFSGAAYLVHEEADKAARVRDYLLQRPARRRTGKAPLFVSQSALTASICRAASSIPIMPGWLISFS